ncbi:MAG: DUF29 domain-containing protein [Bryobacteraceae bacterium]|nr:DUF29 domain-containing protein [Bryobacteraceae bacterium]
MSAVAELYERDFVAWAEKNAELLRSGRLSEIDIENIAEELDGLSRSDSNQLYNRLVVLAHHLMKWQFQPELRGKSWQSTIRDQRARIERQLRSAPSLRPKISGMLEDVFDSARTRALDETNLPDDMFPEGVIYTEEQLLSDWMPE